MRRDAIYKIVQSAYNTEAAIFHRVPMAVTLWNRLIPLVYIVLTFYLLPALVIWLGT